MRRQGWPRPKSLKTEWEKAADAATAATNVERPSDAQVIGAVQRAMRGRCRCRVRGGRVAWGIAQALAGRGPGSYHLEYGFSTMGYEIAGGLGVKMARPDAEVVVMVGDGSYMMLNSELATSVMMGDKADRRGARQSRLWLHQPAADGHRRGELQQSARRTPITR